MDHGVCPACGTWECLDCGWTRRNANRRDESGEVIAQSQTCFRCGSTWGQWWAVRHRNEAKALDHINEYLMRGQGAL